MQIHTSLILSAIACTYFAGLANQLAEAGVIHEVMLTLPAAEPGMNQFGVDGRLDTLSSLGELSSLGGSIQLAGELRASLELEFDQLGGTVTVVGIAFHGLPDDLNQSPVEFDFMSPTGQLAFTTSNLATYLKTRPGQEMTPVHEGSFAATAQVLVNSGGMANLSVPAKPAASQDLSVYPVPSEVDQLMPPDQLPYGSIELTLEQMSEQFAQYRVDVTLPLDGQFLRYGNIGLPTTLSFVDGQLQGSGSLIMAVPEPASGLLVAFITGRLILGYHRRGPVRGHAIRSA